MTTTTKHTPLPWTIGGDGADLFGPKDENGNYPHIADVQPEASGLLGMTAVDRANAKFILKAVSHHDEMLAMLKRLERTCRYHMSDIDSRMAEETMNEAAALIARVEAQS